MEACDAPTTSSIHTILGNNKTLSLQVFPLRTAPPKAAFQTNQITHTPTPCRPTTDQMAESAVSFLLDQLSAWIREESQLLGSLRETAEFIRDEMGRMRAFLRVADAKEETDPQLKEWVNQVRDIAYDAEDVMDKFMLRFADRQTEGFFACIRKISVSIKNLKARHQVASEMRAIQSRIKSISEGHQRYREVYGSASADQEAPHGKSTWYDSRGDALLLEEAEVVGIEKPKKQLIEWITSRDHDTSSGHWKVISVVGTGGLGKTTLVKKVYDDAAVKMNFNSHLWMTVSDLFNLEDFLRTMIRKLVAEVRQPSPQELNVMDADEMKEFVYNFLQHRTYIIVLDDIWMLNAWEAIRYAFPRKDAHGRIIITTRFHNIGHAASIESNGHVYPLEPLSEEESRALFYKKAFLGGPCPSSLEEIVGIVLKRCEGLPLAIVVIGSLLATKNNSIEEWKKFHRSLGDELEGDHLRRMSKLLSLSYYDLPYYLKSCFLYLSIFPADHFIFKSRLIRLWTAEGFIQPKEGKAMEDVAEDYIKELLDRNLIQAAERTTNGTPVRLRVHDILHAIILSKSKEQNFVTVANGINTRWPNRSRRLAIHGSIESMDEIEGCDQLRSVLVLDSLHPMPQQQLTKLLRRHCKLLKVLELRGALSERIPEEIFKLYHLRYLGLKNTKVISIPRSIAKLENLESLDLRNTKVNELPAEILKLRQLRHLLVYHYQFERGQRPFQNVHSFKAPYRIGCLSSLQTLTDIEATDADGTTIVREIGKLTQLKKLGVMKLRKEDGEDLCSSLSKLPSLDSLYVASAEEEEILDLNYSMSSVPPLAILELRGHLEKIPQWIHSLHGLNRLILKWNKITEDPLESLQYLPNLMDLELYHAFEGEGLCFRSPWFQKLKKLWLLSLEGLRWVKLEEGSMSHLQELYMWDCKLIDDVPSGIEHLTNLQYIDFSDMSETFVEKIENQKADGGHKWNLALVPKIEIYTLIAGEWKRRLL